MGFKTEGIILFKEGREDVIKCVVKNVSCFLRSYAEVIFRVEDI